MIMNEGVDLREDRQQGPREAAEVDRVAPPDLIKLCTANSLPREQCPSGQTEAPNSEALVSERPIGAVEDDPERLEISRKQNFAATNFLFAEFASSAVCPSPVWLSTYT